MKSALQLLAKVYDLGADLKNSLYDREILASTKVKYPVLSVGNITMGGTGKTPFVDYLLKYYQTRGLRPAVVAKAYKGKVTEPTQVSLNHPEGPAYYGDEPFLLKERNPQVPIFVGANKLQIAEYASRQGGFDFIIVDDGFQHRALYRDLDIVLIDASERVENYQVVPAGRGRESFGTIKRADLIAITKAHLLTQEKREFLEKSLPAQIPRVDLAYEIFRFSEAMTHKTEPLDKWVGRKVFVLAAIARPDTLTAMLREIGVEIVEVFSHRDHYQYDADDVKLILSRFRSSGGVLTDDRKRCR